MIHPRTKGRVLINRAWLVRLTRCPLFPDSDQIPQRSETTRCAIKRPHAKRRAKAFRTSEKLARLRNSAVPLFLKKTSQPCERNRNENPRRDLRERDRRSPLTTAHVADSQRSYCGPAVLKQALAQDSQRRRSRPPSWIANRALKYAARVVEADGNGKPSTSVSRALGLVRGNGESVMRNPIEIDSHIAAQSFKKLAKDCGRR